MSFCIKENNQTNFQIETICKPKRRCSCICKSSPQKERRVISALQINNNHRLLKNNNVLYPLVVLIVLDYKGYLRSQSFPSGSNAWK